MVQVIQNKHRKDQDCFLIFVCFGLHWDPSRSENSRCRNKELCLSCLSWHQFLERPVKSAPCCCHPSPVGNLIYFIPAQGSFAREKEGRSLWNYFVESVLGPESVPWRKEKNLFSLSPVQIFFPSPQSCWFCIWALVPMFLCQRDWKNKWSCSDLVKPRNKNFSKKWQWFGQKEQFGANDTHFVKPRLKMVSPSWF